MGLFDFFRKMDNKFDLDKVLRMDDNTAVVFALDTRVNELSNYSEDLRNLTEPQKNLLFVENAEREVNNGGFNQFYWNSSGDFAHETLTALQTIGANQMADILMKANSVWPNQTVPKDRTFRQEIQEEIEEQANPTWEECDQEFYKYPDDIADLLIKYVKQHRTEFK
ncbi:MAG: hypothetical protein RL263_1009 [Bacteroidota bacterium]|jgi:hypothetical protein